MQFNYLEMHQKWVFHHIVSDENIMQYLDPHAVFDMRPRNDLIFQNYILLGTQQSKDVSTSTNNLVETVFDLQLYSKEQGFSTLHKISSAVLLRFHECRFADQDIRIISLRFQKAHSQRLNKGNLGLNQLWFKSLVEQNIG